MSANTDAILKSFEMRIPFRCHIPNMDKRISSIKFSSDGEKLISCSNQHTIEIYDCSTATQQTIPCRKYGSGIVDFSNSPDNVIVTSTKRGHAVRELSIEENCYKTCFSGHSDLVTGLAMNGDRNCFLTASRDKKVLLWDIRTPNAQHAHTDLPEAPLIGWHPSNLMFGVGLPDANIIRLFDIRGMESGSFAKFIFNPDLSKWTSLKFSPDGNQILVSTNGSTVRIIDSFTGKLLKVLCGMDFFLLQNLTQTQSEWCFMFAFEFFIGRTNTLNIPIDASFTHNSKYILTGSSDGCLNIYSVNRERGEDAKRVAEIFSNQKEAITEAVYNPKYTMIATASSYVAFWLPAV